MSHGSLPHLATCSEVVRLAGELAAHPRPSYRGIQDVERGVEGTCTFVPTILGVAVPQERPLRVPPPYCIMSTCYGYAMACYAEV